jgi:hypothetical protein
MRKLALAFAAVLGMCGVSRASHVADIINITMTNDGGYMTVPLAIDPTGTEIGFWESAGYPGAWAAWSDYGTAEMTGEGTMVIPANCASWVSAEATNLTESNLILSATCTFTYYTGWDSVNNVPTDPIQTDNVNVGFYTDPVAGGASSQIQTGIGGGYLGVIDTATPSLDTWSYVTMSLTLSYSYQVHGFSKQGP